MTTKLPVAVIVPVRNEAINLPRCLAALGRFAEVVVVDSGSTDRTVEIARASGARVLDFAWDGRYPKKRNWVLLEHPPASPWALFLDADEIVDDRFCDALENALRGTTHVGFWLNYTNYFLGRRLRHGVPQRKLALIRVGHGLYERIDEVAWSRLDMEVHEHPIVDGTVGTIGPPIEHNDDRGLLKFVDRHRDYAVWEACRHAALTRAGEAAWAKLTARQVRKYRNLDRWWFAYAYLFLQYVLKLGFLDGYAGLQYALGKFWYFNMIHVLLYEQRSLTESAKAERLT